MSEVQSMAKYLIYETYATRYIIDPEKLPFHYIDGSEESLIEWFEEHCYHVLSTSLIPDFTRKLIHNLTLAKK